MATLTIDGRTVRAAAGTSVLDAARTAGADIPTLCHHPALEPWGGCRLCLVEVSRQTWPAPKLVTACLYPAENGLVVRCNTEPVRAARAVVLDLLLARCPETALVQRLAREYGIERTSYTASAAPTDCILCGLCTRVCDHVGISAIASVSRGAGREIAPPFRQAPPACIGCMACAEICPTGHIECTTSPTSRTIWGRTFQMVPCSGCGRALVTREQAAWLRETRGLTERDVQLCDACKRRETTATFARLQADATAQESR